jgi:uncharacterized damage-inducible protein DinB
MLEQFKSIVSTQFEAALCMLDDCLRKCPEGAWDAPVAKYPFWEVAYHALIFVDLYLDRSKETFAFRDIHPGGWGEWMDEHPSRRFERQELLDYIQVCRRKAYDVMAGETEASLAEQTGFDWLKFSRAELHLYNLRHLQHHTGQLGACLRKLGAGVDPRWIGRGWK